MGPFFPGMGGVESRGLLKRAPQTRVIRRFVWLIKPLPEPRGYFFFLPLLVSLSEEASRRPAGESEPPEDWRRGAAVRWSPRSPADKLSLVRSLCTRWPSRSALDLTQGPGSVRSGLSTRAFWKPKPLGSANGRRTAHARSLSPGAPSPRGARPPPRGLE